MRILGSALAAIFMGLSSGAWAETAEGSIRYIEYPNVLPAKVLKVRKVMDPNSGRFRLDVAGETAYSLSDLLEFEAEEQRAHRAAHGNLEQKLSERVGVMQEGDRVRVRLTLKREAPVHLDKTRHSLAQLEANAAANASRRTLAPVDFFLFRHGLTPVEIRDENLVIVEANRSQLAALKGDSDLAEAALHVEEVPLSDPELSTLGASGYMASVPSGSGSGVKAATYEYGLTSTFLSCIGVSPSSYDAWTGGTDENKRHAQATFRVLAAAAPSASLYHRKSQAYNGSGDASYITSNGIQTVSMSLSRGNTSPHRATYSEFLSMDEMAYSYPYPVFVHGTGNAGYSYEVNWQLYNGINVGNVRHTNNSTYEMADCIQTKNPPPRYGSCISGSGADCAGDREMPHVVVPGFPSSGSNFATTCLEGVGNITCGTSYSAPLGSGLAADVIAADSRMVSWPEKVRATLILTAQNVESGDWTTSGDERDGAGAISGTEAVAFAQGHTAVSPNNTACEKGLAASSFYASDFSSSKRFNFLVPNPKPSGKHLRVVLTWDSNPNAGAGTNALSDLDLIVQKNGGSQSSSSWDSNVEIVDVAAADLTAGSSYYIDISPYANRIPSGSFFYYSLAWGWVKDHAP